MKLYSIHITLKPFHVYPFQFIVDLWRYIDTESKVHELKQKFYAMNWDHDWVWKETNFCENLRDAVNTLIYFNLTRNPALGKRLRDVVYEGYERGWE